MKTVPASLLTLTLALGMAPVCAQSVALNDEFATREILPSTVPVHWEGYGAELNIEVNDAASVCGYDLDDCEMEGSMWFEWTVPEAGVYEVLGEDPFGLAVFSAPPPPAPQRPSYSLKKTTAWVSWGHLVVEAAAGERLWIMLFDEGDPEPGDRTSLTIAKVTLAGATMETATVLPGTATVHIQQALRGEGWWRWTAPAAGRWRTVSGQPPPEVRRADGSIDANSPMGSFSVAAGEVIYFHDVGVPGALAWLETRIAPFALPANTTAATAQPLAPDADGNGARYSFAGDYYLQFETTNLEAWFSWVAPRDGVAGFMPEQGANGKTYRDDNGSLTRVDEPVNSQRQPWLPVTAGQRYLIAVPAYGPMEVKVEYLLHRGSDSFAGAPEFDPEWRRDYFGDATSEPGEPGLTSPADRTRWWTITPATDGTVYLSGYKVRLYTGNSLNSLTLVTSVDFTGPEQFSTSPVVAVQAGTVFRLQVFGDTRGNGLTTFYVPLRERTANDNFADALPAVTGTRFYAPEGGAWTGTGSNRLNLTGATAEAGEPSATPGVPAEHTAWLRWTADRDSRILMVQQSYFAPVPVANRFDPVIAVWKGSGLTSLERVPQVPFHDPNYSPLVPSFDAVAGTTYFIQVEASIGATEIDLRLTPVFADVSASDAIAGALPAERVIAGLGTAYEMTQHLTFEPGESMEGIAAALAGFTAGSYWIRWTAPSAGVWRFANAGLWHRPYAVYGASLAGGRLGFVSAPESEPVYVKLAVGEAVHLGFIQYQATGDSYQIIYPYLPDISPAVPGIALAKWYGLPSPANLNAAYSPDGIPLLLKHALGLEPLRNSLPGGDDPSGSRWPVLTVNGAGEPALSFRAAAPFQTGAGVDLSGEISRDLRTWSAAPETNAGGVRTVTVPRDGAAGFLRLKAMLR